MCSARRLVVAAGLVVCCCSPVLAAYETGTSGEGDDPFTRIKDVDAYVEEQGEVATTTLKLLQEIGQALHREHQQLQAELKTLKQEMARLTQEVRRLSAGKSR